MSQSTSNLPLGNEAPETSIREGNQDDSGKADCDSRPVPNTFTMLESMLRTAQVATEERKQQHPNPDVLSPSDSPDDMLVKLTSTFRELMTMQENIPEIANIELPTASIPHFLQNADRPKPEGPTYKPHQASSVDNILEMASQSFKVLDKIQEGLAKPGSNIPSSSATQSSSPSNSALNAIMDAISKPQAAPTQGGNTANPQPDQQQQGRPPPSFDVRNAMSSGVTRAFQTNEVLLRRGIYQLSQHLLTVPEDDESYPVLQSTLGLTFLHHYEVTWDDKILDLGVAGTTLALDKMLRLPRLVMVRYAPTVVRSWAYGQRLLVQRDGDVDKLQNTVSILKSHWDIYKNIDVIEERVKVFLRTELALCLLDQYRSTGSLDDLNSSIDHLQAIFKDNDLDTSVGLSLGMAYYERFLHCGRTDDLDSSIHQGQRSSGFGMDFLSSMTPNYDADDAAGHYLYALGLAEQFKATMDAKDLDRSVKQGRKAIDRLHPSHPLRPCYKSSHALILFARYEATNDEKDMQSALEFIHTAVEESKAVVGRHLRVPPEATEGYLTVMSLDSNTKNIPAIEDGIRMISRSRKAFSGATHIESRIENYLSKSILRLVRASTTIDVLDDDQLREHFNSALDHAILAFEKAPEDSPYRHQFGLDMGRLILEKYQTGHASDCDEAIAQFCTTALSPTWPSIRLDAAIQWANALEDKDPAGALDALNVALDILPSIASLGERMPTQYNILSKQRSSIPQRAAMYAIDVNDLVMAVSCLEKGRNILWAQALQLRAGHMLPGGDTRQKEFKSIAGHIMNQREGIPRTMEELEERKRHFPPDQLNRAAPMLDLVQPLMSSYSEVMKRLVDLGGAERTNRNLAMQQDFRDDFMDVYLTAARHGTAKRWNELLSQFDELRGALSFDEASRKDLVSILKKADGSVVVLNAYGSRYDGIVISAAVEPEELAFRHVPFPDISQDEIHAWGQGLREGMEELGTGNITLDEYENRCLVPALRGLWRGIACPILEHFAHLNGEDKVKHRVWWYPTGQMTFVPVHAASPCDGDKPGLLDIVVSSYIPSINSLIRASKAPSLPLKVLAVGQPQTPGLSRLPYAEKEVNALKRVLRGHNEAPTILMGEEAKIYPVISSIPNHTGLHLSCHAHQDEQYPFNSSFYFHDGPLKLSKIMSLDLLRVQFAYLSACLTSAGDAALPDESIHLAAGIQFAGVGSVVATMWSVEDKVAAAVSSRVYGYLLKDGTENADTKRSAEALHEAIGTVKKAEIPLTFIVPFIHLGI